MSFKIFYAWQNDRHPKVNRYFIRDAIQDAIDALHASAEIEDALELDHDTKNVPGIPDIFRTICDKIDGCGIFLADLTFCGTSEPHDDAPAKRMPNSNVMLELGYALKSVGESRIILVMNEAFGAPADLPFDLRTRRHPIRYSASAPQDAKAKDTRRALSEQIKQAIGAITESGVLVPASKPDARKRASERHIEFEQRVLSDQFDGFHGDAGILCLTMTPTKALAEPLDFSSTSASRWRPSTIYTHATEHRVAGRLFKSRTVYTDGSPPVSVSVLREDGSILAVDESLLNSRKFNTFLVQRNPLPAGINGIVPSIAYEKEMGIAVSKNFRAMRAAGVTGDIIACISMLRVQGFVMGTDSPVRHGTIFTGSEIRPDPFVLNDDQAGTPEKALYAMRPAFDYVWREFGLARSHNFDEQGRWIRENIR